MCQQTRRNWDNLRLPQRFEEAQRTVSDRLVAVSRD
jgi:hypothetical protein